MNVTPAQIFANRLQMAHEQATRDAATAAARLKTRTLAGQTATRPPQETRTIQPPRRTP